MTFNFKWGLRSIALCTADHPKISRKTESIALCTADSIEERVFNHKFRNLLHQIQQNEIYRRIIDFLLQKVQSPNKYPTVTSDISYSYSSSLYLNIHLKKEQGTLPHKEERLVFYNFNWPSSLIHIPFCCGISSGTHTLPARQPGSAEWS
ncbi:hypothetical protein D3C76_158650 [compost metagenome]